MERYIDGTGQEVLVHEQHACQGEWCIVHKPHPDSPMAGWPTHWRQDTGVMEQICPHGVGHPAEEQLAHWGKYDMWWKATHGCDGCCQEGGER